MPKVNQIAVKNPQTGEYEIADISSSASNITFDGGNLSLDAEDVQGAIEEVKELVDENTSDIDTLTTTVSTKSTVRVVPALDSGTEVGTVTVDGADTVLYAPTPIVPVDVEGNPDDPAEETLTKILIDDVVYGLPNDQGSIVTVDTIQQSGTNIVDIDVDNVTYHIYAPTPPTVIPNDNAPSQTTTPLTNITVNGDTYTTNQVSANPQGTGTDLETISIDGTIYSIPQGSSTVADLEDLDNVTITSPTEGQVLKYDSTNDVWINGEGGSSVGDLDDLGNVTLTSPTDGQVLKYDGTNQIWINAAESGGGSSTLAGLTDTNVSSPAADQDLSYDSTSSKWINKTHRVELTKAEYDALPSSKLTDGIEYFITDMETTGVEIVANPEDTATDTLIKLQIGDDVYNIDGDGTDVVHLTQAQYDALPSSKLTDDKVYMITDVNGDSSQFQPIIYSENEREIGVWVDGKPLYQKTISGVTISSGTQWIDTGLDINICNIKHSQTVLSQTNGNVLILPSGDPQALGGCNQFANDVSGLTGWGVLFRTSNNDARGTADVTVWYTKTTDAAGSGTWTPQGVPAVHYSTDEQVVGTWIDGNTIYKKTFYNAGGVAQSLNITHGINNLDKCIKYEGTAYDSNDSSRVYVLPRIDYGSVDIGIDHIDSTNIVVGINNNFQTRIIDIYITIYYTKTQGGN